MNPVNKVKDKWIAKWIIDPLFKGISPLPILHKESTNIGRIEHNGNLKNRHMLIRKIFYIGHIDEKITLRITADDYYKLYINDRFIGQGPAPSYYFSYNYNQYDISEYLIEGENIIAVHVYYQGLINRVWCSGDYRQGMIAEIRKGDKCILASDASWKYKITEAYKTSFVTGYETQFLENIDQRLWDEKWTKLSFNDIDWKQVEINEEDDHNLKLQISDNLSVYNKMAKSVEVIDINHYLIDFGEEVTGQFQIEAQGKEGDIIEIRCGEELTESTEKKLQNRVRYQLRCNCVYQEFWTLSGKIDVLNHYDYKGFRYVEVIAPKTVKIDNSFRAVVRHYPLNEDSFTFLSSNKKLNMIIDMCKTTVKYGSQEVFVDCPTREKGQYLGDFTITGHSHLYLSGKTELYKKALLDFADSTIVCLGMMAVAPSGFMQEIADYSMQWPMQLYRYYLHTEDIKFLREMYPIILNLERYFSQYCREDGLIVNVNEKWNLVDWPDNLRDGYDCSLKKPIGNECHNVINIWFFAMMTYSDKIRELLGMEEIYDKDAFVKSFQNVFYNQDTKLFVDKEFSKHSAIHSNSLALYFGLYPTDDYKEIIELIKNRAHLCGVYISYFTLKALASVGEHKLVYELIMSLWTPMVEEGASTCFEVWSKEQKWNTSLCHPWASGPLPIMIEEIIGIKPSEPKGNGISIDPHIPEEIDSLLIEVLIKNERIRVEKKAGRISIIQNGVFVEVK